MDDIMQQVNTNYFQKCVEMLSIIEDYKALAQRSCDINTKLSSKIEATLTDWYSKGLLNYTQFNVTNSYVRQQYYLNSEMKASTMKNLTRISNCINNLYPVIDDSIDMVYQSDIQLTHNLRGIATSLPPPTRLRGAAMTNHEVDQSEERSTNNGGGSYKGEKIYLEQQTIKFLDNAPSIPYEMPRAQYDMDNNDTLSGMDLKDFLSRPVSLGTFTWTNSNTVGTDLISGLWPWYSILTDTQAAQKLNNFCFLRADLRIKIVVNSSPFVYGAARVSWQPLTNFKSEVSYTVSSDLVPMSQLPGAWLYPQLNKGVDMTIPFLSPYNYLDLRSNMDATTSKVTAQNLGVLKVTVYNALASANGAVPKINFKIYAWLENVVLSAQTVTTVLQSEFKLSSVATNISKAAKIAQSIPSIRSYAKTTEIGAKAANALLEGFGYSDVTTIKDNEPVKVENAPYLSNCETGYPFQKLSLDPKNELTIDPKSMGLNAEDPMNISKICQKESYIATFSFSDTIDPDTILFTCPVHPCIRNTNNFTNCVRYALPPVGFVSNMFKQWRGDLIFRFVVIASPFHKARLKIHYDPTPSNTGTTIQSTTDDFEQVIPTTVFDISETQDIEVRVPYSAYSTWLNTDDATGWAYSTSSAPALGYWINSINGFIQVRLLNFLNGPVTSTSVSVNVFMRAADNFELANPAIGDAPYATNNQIDRISFYVYQSAEELNNKALSPDEEQKDEVVIADKINPHLDHLYITYMGECITSLRQLLRRKYKIVRETYTINSSAKALEVIHPPLPIGYGFNPSGTYLARNAANNANKAYSYERQTPITYFSECFLGYRGGVNWWVQAYNTFSTPTNIKVYRHNVTNTLYASTDVTYTTPAGTSAVNKSAAFLADLSIDPTSIGGMAINDYNTSSIAFTIPYYSRYKMIPCSGERMGKHDDGVNNFFYGSNMDFLMRMQVFASSTITYEMYCGIGADFTYSMFLFAQPYYIYATIPVAPV